MEIRSMSKSDIPGVLEITKLIWEGRDYVPKLLDIWINEKNKNFPIVCLENGIIVAIANMVKIGNMGWSEGLRIHPEWRGKGIASMMTKYLLEKFPFNDITTIAFLTNANNSQIIHVAEKMHFKETLRCTMINIGLQDKKGNDSDYFSEIAPKFTIMQEFSISEYFLSCFKIRPVHEDTFMSLQKEKWFLSSDKSILVIYEINNSETSATRIFASVNSKTIISNQYIINIINFCCSLLKNDKQKISISIPNELIKNEIKTQIIKLSDWSEQVGFALSVKIGKILNS